MTLTKAAPALSLLLACALTAQAQTTPAKPATTDCRDQPTRTAMIDCANARAQIKTIHLSNVGSPTDGNEILTAVRNMGDPSDKLFLVPGQNAIVISSYPEEISRMETLIHELDQPKKSYRLTFTLATFEGTKRLETRHFTLVAEAGQRTTLKQGVKVPIATGSYKAEAGKPETQFTYLDVGVNLDVTLTPLGKTLQLKAKVEQSVLGEEKSTAVENDPTIHQAVLEGTSLLTPGKPLTIGSMELAGELAGTTHRIEIEVTAEPQP